MDRVKRRGVLAAKSCRSAKFVEETESDETIKFRAAKNCTVAKLQNDFRKAVQKKTENRADGRTKKILRNMIFLKVFRKQ